MLSEFVENILCGMWIPVSMNEANMFAMLDGMARVGMVIGQIADNSDFFLSISD